MLSQGTTWFPMCIFSAVWCGLRAQRHGHNWWLYASIGLLLGPGSGPVVWLETQADLQSGKSGLGFIETKPHPETSHQLLAWARLDRGWRQLRSGLLFGVAMGFFIQLTQALCNILPSLYQETPEEYERGVHPEHLIELKIRFLWSVAVLVGPVMLYWVSNRWLQPKPVARLWTLYAFQAAGLRWRELVPENLRSLPDPTLENPEPIRKRMEERILHWSPGIVPALLIAFFLVVILLCIAGFQIYIWLGNAQW